MLARDVGLEPMPRPLARGLVGLALALGLACKPQEPPEPPAPPPAVTTGDLATQSPAIEPAATDPAALAAAGLPHTCTIELELLLPSGATSRGASDHSAEQARQAAWAQACAQLQQSAGLDCRDPERVDVLSQRSTSLRTVVSDGTFRERFEFELVLATRRTAEGFGDAPNDRAEACRRAKAHACEQLLGGPCPDAGVRVIAVDGKPPSAAAVEPVPTTPRPRQTI